MIRTLLALVLCAAGIAPAAAVDLAPLDTMPVQHGGRKKPYIVFAQENLLALSGSARLDTGEGKKNAAEIIASIWLEPEKWGARPIILIANRPLKQAAGLPPDRKWFSRDELAGSAGFVALLQKAEAARRTARDGKLADQDQKVAEIGSRIAALDTLRNGDVFRVAANPDSADATWRALPQDDKGLTALRSAFASRDDTAFARAAHGLRTELAAMSPSFQPPVWKMDMEVAYQKIHPFRWAWILYLAAGITLAVTSLRGRQVGYLLAWLLAGAGALLQVGGFVCRILIAGRPPVSNMYESVIWVAFGAVAFALIFESIYRSRYFLLGACFAAVLPLLLADMQPLALDRSIQPLVPILQSNFWLATHVLIITLSYAAFLLALGVAHISLGKVILGRSPTPALYNYIYRTLQVGVLLLAVGTILGAVWANYSWGRFWDWDPKETWALIALLAYLFVLHGRIAGIWAGFGLSVGAVLGFITIVMAWYGVNFVLGVGLHSYGFGSGGFGYALIFVIAEIAFVGLAIARHRGGGKIAATTAA